MTNINNVVAFAILMEDIQTKSPNYIMEKFNRYCLAEEDVSQWGLDFPNRMDLEEWQSNWTEKENQTTHLADKA